MKALKYLLALGLTAIGLLLLLPRSYDRGLPSEKREGVTFWELPTGSIIAYSQIIGKEPRQTSPIIYLHGGPGGMVSESFIKTLSPLTELGYDLYFYDQIGGGLSARLEDIEAYTVQRHQKDLEAIVQKIGAPKVILIGQSWGALLLTQFLADHPEKVEKAIVTGPGPILPVNQELRNVPPPDNLHLKEPSFSNEAGNRKIYNWRSKFIRWWGLRFGIKWASDWEVDHFFAVLNSELRKSTVCDPSKANLSASGGGYYAHIRTVKSFQEVPDKRMAMQKVTCPMLVMKGQCDNQKWGFTKEYLDLFPKSELTIIDGAGHLISTERPEEYLEKISSFLLEN